MNERINQLANIWANRRSEDEKLGITYTFSEKALETFAELIVKKVLDEVSTRAFVSGDRAWSDDADRHWVELEFGFGRLAKLKKK